VVASNWDVSLHDVLCDTGLHGLVDGVVTSAEVGVAKPDGRLFAAALEVAGVPPGEALHVGDDPEADAAGALAAGLAAVLLARDGTVRAPAGAAVVHHLGAVADLVRPTIGPQR